MARAIVGLSQMAVELGEVLDALDINPLRCGPGGCLALDVLVGAAARHRHGGGQKMT